MNRFRFANDEVRGSMNALERIDLPTVARGPQQSSEDAHSGYLHADYAGSLAAYGQPLRLRESGGFVLVRGIPGSPCRDGMGCYPLFCCRNWRALPADLDGLGGAIVSLTLVTDPFGDFTESSLAAAFPRVLRFKEHLVVDLAHRPETFVSRHHRRYWRWADERLEVETCDPAISGLNEWSALYGDFTAQRNVTGIRAFSREAFAGQLCVPGAVLFLARHQGTTVGAHFWYRQGDVAYSHLVASNEKGYEMRAAFALYGHALRWFADRVAFLDLGAGAGLGTKIDDGLTDFKRGWANATRPVYLCGRVFDAPQYADLTASRGQTGVPYFPAYRAGEFA